MPLRLSGLLALGCWLAHAVDSILRREPNNLLWTCNLAALFVGLGQLRGSAGLNALGCFWLFWGVPVWLVGLLGAEPWVCSSAFTHLGGLALGVYGLKRLGLPRGIWWKALAAVVALQQLCRWITPPAENVNLAFAIWGGWDRWFPSYLLYWCFLVAASGTIFLAMEAALARVIEKRA